LTSSTPSTIEPLYVLDTHALIWYLRQDPKLGVQAKAVFEAAERHQTILIVPSIVVAELYYANAKHHLFPSFEAMYEDLIAKPYIRVVPFEHADVLDFDADSAVPEMHDRIITGVARRLNAPLLTSDPQIVSAGIVKTTW
jgi:PIN domain nuclease of toxin-antitoxin system